MTQTVPSWPTSRPQIGLARCAMILILVMLGFTVVCLPLAFWLRGNAIESLLAAVGVCITPGLAALVVSTYFSSVGQPLIGMLIAMGCRMLPPLVVCLWLALNRDAVNGRVFAGFLIAAYLVSLAVETFVSVRSVDSSSNLALKG